MDIIRIEVDSRILLHQQKEEMLLQLERAVAAIYGGKASVMVEPNITRLRQRWAASQAKSARSILEFGRKASCTAGGNSEAGDDGEYG